MDLLPPNVQETAAALMLTWNGRKRHKKRKTAKKKRKTAKKRKNATNATNAPNAEEEHVKKGTKEVADVK